MFEQCYYFKLLLLFLNLQTAVKICKNEVRGKVLLHDFFLQHQFVTNDQHKMLRFSHIHILSSFKKTYRNETFHTGIKVFKKKKSVNNTVQL